MVKIYLHPPVPSGSGSADFLQWDREDKAEERGILGVPYGVPWGVPGPGGGVPWDRYRVSSCVRQ